MCGPVNLQQIFAAFPAGGVIRQTNIDRELFGRYGRLFECIMQTDLKETSTAMEILLFP